MTNYKPIIALSIVGYVCVLALRYIEGILISLSKVFGMILNVNPKVYIFLDIVPEILILILWILIMFKFLKGFSWNETFMDIIPKKFGIRLGTTVLVLFLILLVVRYIEEYWWANKTNYYNLDQNLLMVKSYILSGLNLLEIIIIVIGFIKLINKKNTDANTQYSQKGF